MCVPQKGEPMERRTPRVLLCDHIVEPSFGVAELRLHPCQLASFCLGSSGSGIAKQIQLPKNFPELCLPVPLEMCMKTYYWLNRNRLLPHLRLAAAGWALVFVSAVLWITPTIATAEDTHNTVFSVMTRNMDLGSDYGPALAAHDPNSFFHGVTTIYNEIVASNIAERAAGIAREIQETMPTVVSLQEVSLVQRFVWTGTPGPFIDQIDQLAALRTALAQLGLSYSLALEVHELDIAAPSDAGYLLRIRDSEAILVRSDLPANILTVSNPQPATITIYSRSKRPSAP